MSLKVAVVGCGRIALSVHLPNLRTLRDVSVSAIVDPDPKRRERALQLCPQAAAFESPDQLWDAVPAVPVDAMLISTPSADHAAHTLEAIAHGVHLYVEKPLATGSGDAEELVTAWKKAGSVGMTGFNSRFHPLYVQARRLLSEDAVGRPLMVSTVFSSSISIVNDWRARRQNGGGTLFDLGSHHVDLIHFLFGEDVTEVRAQTASTHAEDDSATLQMRLRNGVLVSSMFSFGGVDLDRIEIFGDRGVLRADRTLSTACELIPRDRPQARLRQVSNSLSFLWRPGAILSKRTPGGDPSYRPAMEHFVQSALAGSPCSPDFDDGLRAVQVILAAHRSAQEGGWVDVAMAGGASS
jgi:predicted dehydrogenase